MTESLPVDARGLGFERVVGANNDLGAFEIAIANTDPVINALDTDASTLDQKSTDKTVVLNGFVTDEGQSDTHSVVVDWGDGNVETIVDAGDLIASPDFSGTTHQYATGGIYTITVTVTDDQGGVAIAETRAYVQGVGIVDDVLYVIGTEGRDNVDIRESRDQIRVQTKLHRQRWSIDFFDRSDFGSIHVIGCDGNDRIHLAHSIAHDATIDGGAGHDRIVGGNGNNLIYAGPGNDSVLTRWGDDRIDAGDGNDWVNSGGGNDILLGGLGNDLLRGGTGRDLLIGGIGRDSLSGRLDDDILIAGTTSLAMTCRPWNKYSPSGEAIEALRNAKTTSAWERD